MLVVFDRIKKLSEKRGESINDVEKHLGYSLNTLYRLKRSNPSAKKVIELADYFDVTTDYLLGRSDQPHAVEATFSSLVSDIFGAQLAKEVAKLDDAHKQRVYAYTQAQVEDQDSFDQPDTLAAHQADPSHHIDKAEAKKIAETLDGIIDEYEKKK
ncbi:helix-turn-helix transcriptional regulator [Levilactobacillus namurensis]|uniref:helix-turn-helix domain-containing protein n=1 Tax=Levilactobacillus namurensis TaxID=380393 RepID=UPI000463D55F|nr:helix-turn-helix transcriptional regulator [Levilactobacillus namurensis]MDT7019333.1 helix-turn-helix transcriptional regulator [Levilactobacillus namurensis]WNN66067.1 helix-turn-helix transcriptional regulator [Levilactobacillus namurensis]